MTLYLIISLTKFKDIMTRLLYYNYEDALQGATELFIRGIKSIVREDRIEGADEASPAGSGRSRLFMYLQEGKVPPERPGFTLLDKDGKLVAVCYYYHQEHRKREGKILYDDRSL